MRKSDLQFYQDTQIIRQLLQEPSMDKTAQDSLGGAVSSITDHLKSQYDPTHPVESILAFMVPGALWTFGFRWVAVIYELAEALGWNWREFFSSLSEKLKPFLEQLTSGIPKDSSEVNQIVQESANQAFTDAKIDISKIEELAKSASLNDMLRIKKIAIKYSTSEDKSLILRALEGLGGNRMRKGILGFIVRVFAWVLTAGLVSLGFSLGGALVSKVLGIKKDTPGSSNDPNQPKEAPGPTEADKQHISLTLNDKADPSLSQTNFNGNGHIWLLNNNLSEMKQQLISWAQNLYPQLSDPNAFNSSPYFNNTLKLFQDRNKGADDIGITAVPTNFTSIKQIVDSFAADVAAHSSSTQNTSYK